MREKGAVTPDVSCTQGQINHWANWANARGLALLGPRAWLLKHSFTGFSCLLGCSTRVKTF